MAVLLNVMGAKTYNLLCRLTTPIKSTDKTFAEIVEILQNHLPPKPVVIAKCFHFYRLNEKENETISEYVTE